MPLVVSLLAEMGLISEGVAAVIGAIAGSMAILHAWKVIRAAVAARRA